MADRNLKQVETVFQAALDLPAGERAAYVAQACAGNESLYAEVYSLVSAADTHNGFIDKPVVNLGFEVLSRSEDESMIGSQIGSYKILSRLGKGGMGQVYLAEDTRLDRKVALKFLSYELVNDNWAKRQLAKEARAAAMLDHSNICSVYDFEELGDQTFIVMQFIEGETLADLIRKKQISLDQVLDLTQQIVSALSEAHAHGEAGASHVLLARLNGLGDAEVDDLHEIDASASLGDHDVVGLQVAVHDAHVVSDCKGISRLTNNLGRACRLERALLLDHLRERRTVHELHRQEDQPVRRLTEVVDARDVRVVDATRVRRLAVEPADGIR